MCGREETHISKLSYKSHEKNEKKCTHKFSHDACFLYISVMFLLFEMEQRLNVEKLCKVKDLYIDTKSYGVIQFDLR